MVEGALRNDREAGRFRREIALVGHGHEIVPPSEREDDLGCTREERANFEIGGHSALSVVKEVGAVKQAMFRWCEA
jgi:hypothetical protein